MIEIFYPDADGKIRFTKKQLEELLKRVYKQGHDDGYAIGSANRYYWSWTYPSWTSNTTTTPNFTVKTTNSAPKSNDNITWCTNEDDLIFNKDIKYCNEINNIFDDTVDQIKTYKNLSDFKKFFDGIFDIKEED